MSGLRLFCRGAHSYVLPAKVPVACRTRHLRLTIQAGLLAVVCVMEAYHRKTIGAVGNGGHTQVSVMPWDEKRATVIGL